MSIVNIGALREPKPPHANPRRHPEDYFGTQPGSSAHVARAPNTQYRQQLMHYNQRKQEYYARHVEAGRQDVLKVQRHLSTIKHQAKAQLSNLIKQKMKKKLEDLSAEIPARREKLQRIYSKERTEYLMEILANIKQDAMDSRVKMEKKVADFRKQKEEDHDKFVHDKRIQQALEYCDEIRQLRDHHNLLETKRVQLIQIREKEYDQAAEAELDQKWHELKMMMVEALNANENQKEMCRKLKELEAFENCKQQIAAKKLIMEEIKRMTEEENKNLLILAEERKQEEMEEKKREQVKRQETRNMFEKQLKERQEYEKNLREEQKMIDDAFNQGAIMELKAEKLESTNRKGQLRRENAMFRDYLEQIAAAKKQDEANLMLLTNAERIRLETIQAESYKAMCEYRKRLNEEIKLEREAILERRKLAEVKDRDAEIQHMKRMLEINKKLDSENQRKLKAEQLKYGEILKAQIVETNEMRRKEKEEARRMPVDDLQKQKDEILEAYFEGNVKIGEMNQHPFANVVNKNICCCPAGKVTGTS